MILQVIVRIHKIIDRRSKFAIDVNHSIRLIKKSVPDVITREERMFFRSERSNPPRKMVDCYVGLKPSSQ